MSAWIWGVVFQSSLLGGGRSLTLEALAVFDRLPVLQNNNNCISSTSALGKIDAAKCSVRLTCISSRIQNSEPSLFPQKVNARTRLRTPHPFQSRTGRRRLHHKPNVCSGCGVELQEAYLQRLVVPAVGPVLLATSAVQHEQGPVAVPGLQTGGLIQTHHAQAGLDEGQRIPVRLIWMADEKRPALVV